MKNEVTTYAIRHAVVEHKSSKRIVSIAL